MKTIFTITTVSHRFFPRHSRCWGYYFSLEEVEHALNNNIGSMHECLYDYAVVEEYSPGIVGMGEMISWWKYEQGGGWNKIEETPLRFQGTVNFAIG